MRKTRKIKNFIFSHYFSDGLRVTLGALLPSLLFAQLGQLQTGIIISLGALCTSFPDQPGPLKHRRNGMLYCILSIGISAMVTGMLNNNTYLLAALIVIFCFIFSMFIVYGSRASSVGTSALLIMIINIDNHGSMNETIHYALLLVYGGGWYFLMSLALSQIRPYRLAQQELSECVHQISLYLNYRAAFYDIEEDINETYKKLIAQQVLVHQHQDAVREHLFKKNMITMNINQPVRQLILVFVDMNDLFEQSMAILYDYENIREIYGQTGVLKTFQKTIIKVADELENIAYHILLNEVPANRYDFQNILEKLKSDIDDVDKNHGINTLVLKKILVSIRNMIYRIQKIHTYFDLKQIENQKISREPDLPRFISHQDFDLKQIRNNLTLSSSIFRHSLRVAIVMLIGFTISRTFQFGHHSYWILLTILVILKPAFSMTKQKNYERLIGTVIGGIAGAVMVYFIKDEFARFSLMLIFMLAAFSLQRINYVVSVLFMTPYLILIFSFLGLNNLQIAQERIVDTLVGSFIAFIASYFLFPSWEYEQVKEFMRKALIANYNYLLKVAEGLTGQKLNITSYKLARKEVYVSSANLGSAFQRMLSEPKSKQLQANNLQKFVVFNHSLSSYTATLLASIQEKENRFLNPGHVKRIKKSLFLLAEAIRKFDTDNNTFTDAEIKIPKLTREISDTGLDSQLLDEQLDFVNKLTSDIQKVSEKLA